MKIDAEKKILEEQQQPWTRRRMATVGVLGIAAVFVSGCLGGGGGDSSDDDVDLRAAYDRIQEGMTIRDVERVVGVPANMHNQGRRDWERGNEGLYVSFSEFGEQWLVMGVIWKGNGNSLTKTY